MMLMAYQEHSRRNLDSIYMSHYWGTANGDIQGISIKLNLDRIQAPVGMICWTI